MSRIPINMKLSEQQLLTVEIDAPSGSTMTLTGATWTLFDRNDAVLAGPTPCGYTAGAAAIVKGFVAFSPSANGLSPGMYVVTVKATGTGSDTQSRTREQSYLIVVTADDQ